MSNGYISRAVRVAHDGNRWLSDPWQWKLMDRLPDDHPYQQPDWKMRQFDYLLEQMTNAQAGALNRRNRRKRMAEARTSRGG